MAAKYHLQTHGAGRTWLLRLGTVALALLATYLVFEFGRISAGYDMVDAATNAPRSRSISTPLTTRLPS